MSDVLRDILTQTATVYLLVVMVTLLATGGHLFLHSGPIKEPRRSRAACIASVYVEF